MKQREKAHVFHSCKVARVASRELWMQKAEAWLLPTFGTGRLEPALEVLFELQKLPRCRVTLKKREWYD